MSNHITTNNRLLDYNKKKIKKNNYTDIIKKNELLNNQQIINKSAEIIANANRLKHTDTLIKNANNSILSPDTIIKDSIIPVMKIEKNEKENEKIKQKFNFVSESWDDVADNFRKHRTNTPYKTIIDEKKGDFEKLYNEEKTNKELFRNLQKEQKEINEIMKNTINNKNNNTTTDEIKDVVEQLIKKENNVFGKLLENYILVHKVTNKDKVGVLEKLAAKEEERKTHDEILKGIFSKEKEAYHKKSFKQKYVFIYDLKQDSNGSIDVNENKLERYKRMQKDQTEVVRKAEQLLRICYDANLLNMDMLDKETAEKVLSTTSIIDEYKKNVDTTLNTINTNKQNKNNSQINTSKDLDDLINSI